MYLFADLTKAFVESEQSAFDGLLDTLGAEQKPESVVALLRPDQSLVARDDLTTVVHSVDNDDESVLVVLTEHIKQAIASETATTFASFRGRVRQTVQEIGSIYAFITYSMFPPPQTGAARVSGEPPRWNSSFIPVEQALETLRLCLQDSSTGYRMTDLRSLLQARDDRFRKHLGTPSAQPRFIGGLIQAARERGLVQVLPTRPDDPNPVVALKPSGSRGSADTPTVGASSRPASTPTETGSNLFITVLRKNGFGPFQEVRFAIYDAIEERVGGAPFNLYSVISDAIAYVHANQADALIKGAKQYPWSRVRSFILKLFSLAPAVSYSEGVSQFKWQQQDLLVSELSQDWRQVLDGEMIKFLLVSGVEVSIEDCVDLAGALCNSRRPEAYDHIFNAITRLITKGDILVGGPPTFRFSLPGQP